MAKKINKTTWILSSLKKHGLEKTKKRFNAFSKAFPKDTSETSFLVSVRREARLNVDNVSKLAEEKKAKLKAKEEQKKFEAKEKLKYKILGSFSLLAMKMKLVPSFKDLKEAAGYSHFDIHSIFKDKKDLEDQAREEFGWRFNEVIDPSIWNKKRLDELQSLINKHDRFVITTYLNGDDIHTGFWDAIQSYCKKKNAIPLIIVGDNQIATIPTSMQKENIVYADMKINNNLYVSSIKILPKMIEPTTGLNRIGGKTGSFIFGSPKQRLVYIPTHTNDMVPHCIMTTGAMTFGEYQGHKYYQKRTDYLAEQDHKIGAIVVEKENQQVFHFRQLQADNAGAFIDLGVRFKPDGKTEKVSAEAIVYGDWHSGDTDPKVALANANLAKEVGAKRLVIHDGFNGESINHHVQNQAIAKAMRAEKHRDDLTEELDGYANDLNELSEIYDEIDIVWSNHDEFMLKYLNAADYVNDSKNKRLALHLAIQAVDGKNPIEWYVSQRLKNKNKVKWLGVDDDYKISGIKISDHGHLGANGSRGTLAGLEKTTSKAVYGHTHTPQILREAWQVGTSTYLRLNYTKGPGSWVNACCLIYPGGYRQLINCIGGKYRI